MINKFSNHDVAELLRKIEAIYIIKEENHFKITAYQEAADSIEKLGREIREIWREGKLMDIPGIGKSISAYSN